MGKFNFEESPVKKVAEEIRDGESHAAVSTMSPAAELLGTVTEDHVAKPQGTVAVEPVAKPQGTVAAQPVAPLAQGEPIPYNEVLKNVGAKIPYSVYDRLERIKRMSERSGIRSEKRNIGDLIAQAIKEFVEKYDV